MADGADNIGNLEVGITADFSGLQAAIDAAAAAVQSAADKINASLGSVEEKSKEAEGGIHSLSEQFAALAEALVVTEGLKEFGEEALKAYGTVQSVTIGLTQLTGSATQAAEIISQVKELAATEPFAFPELAPTIQKMVALGVSAEAIPGVMHAVADAAAATGNSFEGVANAFDRMALSGTVNARSLVQLGIGTTQLAQAMGVAGSEVKTMFAALDQTTRIQVLQDALGKFAGAAEAQAKGIAGQWQIFQNQFEEVMVGVGEALAPVVGDILAFGKSVLGAIQEAIDVFNKFPEPVKDAAVALGLVAAAIAPLAAVVSAAGFAVIGFNTAWETGSAILASFRGTAQQAAVAEGELAVAAGAATVAEEAQTVATLELATAQKGLGGGVGAVAGGVTTLSGALSVLGGTVMPVVIGATAGWALGKMSADAAIADNNVRTMTAGMGAWSVSAQDAASSISALENVLPALLAQLKDQGSAVTDVTDKMRILTAGFDAIVKVQADASSRANQLHVAYELAKLALDNTTQGTQAYTNALLTANRAQKEWESAVDSANVHGKDFAFTLAGIVKDSTDGARHFSELAAAFNSVADAAGNNSQATALAAATYTKLESAAKASGVAFADYRGILAQVQVATDQNYASYQALGAAYGTLLTLQQHGVDVTAQLADVYKQWQAAGDKVGVAISTIAGVMAGLTQAADKQQTSLTDTVGAFAKFEAIQAPTVTQVNATRAAFQAITSQADAMGIQLNLSGDGFGFAAKEGTAATPALQAYIDKLNGILGTTGPLIDANGHWVQSLKALPDWVQQLIASLDKQKGSTDGATSAVKSNTAALGDNAAAAQRARQAHIDLGSTYQTTHDLVVSLTNAGKEQVTGLEDAVKAFVDLDSTTQTTVAGQIALQNAFKNAQAAGQALGITITATGAAASGNATPAVQALAKQLNDAIQAMAAGSAGANQLSGSLEGVAAAAADAAQKMAGFTAAEKNASGSSILGRPASGSLGEGAAPGTSISSGGSGQYYVVPLPRDPNPGKDYWDGEEWATIPANYDPSRFSSGVGSFTPPTGPGTATPGGPSSSSGGSSSGITALASAASGAAPIVQALGAAASSAATPLGAFVTGIDGLNGAIAPVVQALASTSNTAQSVSDHFDQMSQAEQDYQQKVADSINANDAYTNALNSGTATADHLFQLMQAMVDANTAALPHIQLLGDATQSTGVALLSTSATAASVSDHFDQLSQAEKDYQQKVADSINAQNAYSNALNSGTATANDLFKLMQAMVQAGYAAAGGQTGGSDINTTSSTSAGGPNAAQLAARPSGPPSGASPNGAWAWDPTSQQWVWQAGTAQGQIGLSSKQFDPGNNVDAFQPNIQGTGGLGALNSPASGGVTIQVNIGGTYVGPNAGKQLADLAAPAIVASLRQAGVKL